jgi:hypothetical protein
VSDHVISYIEMCRREHTSLQQGMNFGLSGNHSVILMSVLSSTRAMISPRLLRVRIRRLSTSRSSIRVGAQLRMEDFMLLPK